eukprot:84113_1
MTRLTNNGHGGHRANQNGPTPTPNRRTRGLRRKKKNFKKKKGTASDYRRLQMKAISSNRRKNEKIKRLTYELDETKEQRDRLKEQRDELYNNLGTYLDRNEMQKLEDKLNILAD